MAKKKVLKFFVPNQKQLRVEFFLFIKGNSTPSLEDLNDLLEEARKDFPDLESKNLFACKTGHLFRPATHSFALKFSRIVESHQSCEELTDSVSSYKETTMNKLIGTVVKGHF